MDFQAVKQAVPIEQAARFLGLKLKQHGETFRCPCQICNKAGERAITITPRINRWYCHGCKKGGDQVYLTAHWNGVTQTQAAKLLQEHFMREPERPKSKKTSRKGKPSARPQSSRRGAMPITEEYTIVDWLQL